MFAKLAALSTEFSLDKMAEDQGFSAEAASKEQPDDGIGLAGALAPPPPAPEPPRESSQERELAAKLQDVVAKYRKLASKASAMQKQLHTLRGQVTTERQARGLALLRSSSSSSSSSFSSSSLSGKRNALLRWRLNAALASRGQEEGGEELRRAQELLQLKEAELAALEAELAALQEAAEEADERVSEKEEQLQELSGRVTVQQGEIEKRDALLKAAGEELRSLREAHEEHSQLKAEQGELERSQRFLREAQELLEAKEGELLALKHPPKELELRVAAVVELEGVSWCHLRYPTAAAGAEYPRWAPETKVLSWLRARGEAGSRESWPAPLQQQHREEMSGLEARARAAEEETEALRAQLQGAAAAEEMAATAQAELEHTRSKLAQTTADLKKAAADFSDYRDRTTAAAAEIPSEPSTSGASAAEVELQAELVRMQRRLTSAQAGLEAAEKRAETAELHRGAFEAKAAAANQRCDGLAEDAQVHAEALAAAAKRHEQLELELSRMRRQVSDLELQKATGAAAGAATAPTPPPASGQEPLSPRGVMELAVKAALEGGPAPGAERERRPSASEPAKPMIVVQELRAQASRDRSKIQKLTAEVAAAKEDIRRARHATAEAEQETEGMRRRMEREAALTGSENVSLEYLKNVVLSYVRTGDPDEHRRLLPVIATVLRFSEAERKEADDEIAQRTFAGHAVATEISSWVSWGKKAITRQ